tara:strand:+ start:154 stop:402 length:249 start_codon:yes stop_codon:yes gene_type:complete
MAELPHQPLNADYNLCSLSREEQAYLSAKTLAHYWLHQKRHKQMTRQDINKRLNEMPEQQREMHRRALNEAMKERKLYDAQK